MATLPDLPATDPNTAQQPQPDQPAATTNPFEFDLPAEGGKFTIDLAAIPPQTRMELLKNAVKQAIYNRANVANVRFNKANEPFAAYDAYAAAKAAYDADPITNKAPDAVVAAPAADAKRPTPVDVRALAQAGADALLKGELNRRSRDGEHKAARTPKDPVDALVTQTVRNELITKNKASNPKYGLIDANKELAAVGGSGVAFLKARIDTAVQGGADRTALEAMLETRYMAPARMMAGVDNLKGKKAELPNIL